MTKAFKDGASLRRAVRRARDELDLEEEALLDAASADLDLARQCETAIEAEGLQVLNARGQRTAHPLLAVRSQAQIRLARALAKLRV